MKKINILLVLLITFYSAFTQQKEVFYYTFNWEITPHTNATFYRTSSYDSLNMIFFGEVKDYSMDSTLIMKGFYSRYGSKEGEFIFYYPSGQLQAQGYFRNDQRDSLWKYYFEDGKLEREVKFKNGSFSPQIVYDASGKKIIENGTGMWHFEYRWYGEIEPYRITGKFKNGKMDSTWICELGNGKLVYREIYKNGVFINGNLSQPEIVRLEKPIDNKFMPPFKFEVTEKFIYTAGTERANYPFLSFLPGPIPDSAKHRAKYPQPVTLAGDEAYFKVEEPAEFPGGINALAKFIQLNIKYPSEARRLGFEGKIFVKFIVEKDGSLSNMEILKGVHRSLNLEAIRVISSFPNWVPGKQDGKIVRSQFVLPVFFKLGR